MDDYRNTELDFEIDKLTSSIENAISGEIFDTVVTQIKQVREIQQTDWVFNWHAELNGKSTLVFKLSILNEPDIIQGLISMTDKGDHIFMNLIENSAFNKGQEKQYKGVAGNLVSFACKMSFERGYDGIVSFVAKTQLIKHYEQTLGAKLFSGNRMFIDTKDAYTLVNSYFKDFRL